MKVKTVEFDGELKKVYEIAPNTYQVIEEEHINPIEKKFNEILSKLTEIETKLNLLIKGGGS